MNKRKILGILVPLCAIFAMIPIMNVSAAKNPYKDVSKTDWYYDSVIEANENGLMNGMTDDTFEPQTTMSRAMVVTVLHRMEGEPEATSTSSTFSDVPADAWFTKSVAWASANGIVNGYDQGSFGPNDDVTREQIATILFRYAGNKSYDVSKRGDLKKYADNELVSYWAKDTMAWANAEGLVVGLDENTLAPGKNATRAEVATILQCFCEKYAKKGDEPVDKPETPEEKTFTLTFDYNYDSKGTFKTIEVKEGEKAGMVEQPTRAGYRFTGWYTEAKNGETYDSENAIIDSDLTLFAHWSRQLTGGGSGTSKPVDPTKPDNYSISGEYYKEHSEIVNVKDVRESEDVLTEAEAVELMEDRGFGDYEITYDYLIDGEFSDEIEAIEGKTAKHPIYHTYYLTEAGEAWLIYIIEDSVIASPISYNMESTLESELLIAESEIVTSYDPKTNQFYDTIPKSSGAIIKVVDKIDADTLERLTVEEIDKLN